MKPIFVTRRYYWILVVTVLLFHSAIGQEIPDIKNIENDTDPKLDYARKGDNFKVFFEEEYNGTLQDLRLQINGVKYKWPAPKVTSDRTWIMFLLEDDKKPNLWDDLFKEGEYEKQVTIEVAEKDGEKVTENWKYYTLMNKEKPAILEIYGHTKQNEKNTIKFDDRIVIKLNNLNFNADLDTKDLILYIDGIPFEEIKADVNSEEKRLYYTLTKSLDQDDDPWDLFFKGKSNDTLKLSVGLKNGMTTESKNVQLIFYNPKMGRIAWAVCSILLVVFLYVLVFFIMKTPKFKKFIPTSSYSTMQLYSWTFIVLSSFTFILLTTNNMNFSVTAGALIGINLATGATEAIFRVDGKEIGSKELTIGIFQIIFFNLIFIVYFVFNVYNRLEMPEFTEAQLLLLGISSAGYASFVYVGSTKSSQTKNMAVKSKPSSESG